jgi:2-iminobutanoate/2-iminopropanoate deaminase
LFKQEKIKEDKMARTLLGAPRKVPTKQTKQTMENIKTTLEACGSSMDNIDKCTIYTPTIDNVSGLNEVYYSYFPPDSTPARACIIAGLAHPDLMLEIEVIAHVED